MSIIGSFLFLPALGLVWLAETLWWVVVNCWWALLIVYLYAVVFHFKR